MRGLHLVGVRQGEELTRQDKGVLEQLVTYVVARELDTATDTHRLVQLVGPLLADEAATGHGAGKRRTVDDGDHDDTTSQRRNTFAHRKLSILVVLYRRPDPCLTCAAPGRLHVSISTCGEVEASSQPNLPSRLYHCLTPRLLRPCTLLPCTYEALVDLSLRR